MTGEDGGQAGGGEGRRRVPLRRATLALPLLVLLLAGAAPVQEPSSQAISDAVEDEWVHDPAVPAHHITATTRGGVVTLTGRVRHLLAKERAARVASAVRGVRAVVNRIEVDPTPRPSDTILRVEIRNGLQSDPVTEATEIGVGVNEGVVTLTGQVDSWQEAEVARVVAARIRGVREVVNRIEVEPKATRPPQEIKADVVEALRRDVFVDGALIAVDVEGQEVTLTGTVGSAAEKLWARANAYVAGVRRVDVSRLEVEPWARNPDLRSEKYLTREDDAIRQAVGDALLLDPRTGAQEIDVSVTDAVVTLRGTVDNLPAKIAAEATAWGTAGVLHVDNRLRVAWGSELASEEIERGIRRALRWDPYLEHREIRVGVAVGVVRLAGTVDTAYEKTRASSIAATVPGVVDVENDLRITSPGPGLANPYVEGVYVTYRNYPYDPILIETSDRRIREEVFNQLTWSAFLDPDRIEVDVEDGVVTLQGQVDSWAQRYAAVKDAFDAGAIRVNNRLTLPTRPTDTDQNPPD